MEGEQNTNQNPAPTIAPVTSTESPIKPIDHNAIMGVLAYLGILIIVPYLMAKENPFVNFHIRQGLVLIVIWGATWVLGMLVWKLYPILGIVKLATLVLSIVGIVNVLQGKQKELPLVGQFAKHFNI